MAMTSGVEHLTCDTCEKRFAPGEVELTCPDCGPDRGTLTVSYDYDRIAGQLTRGSVPRRSWKPT